MSVLALPGSPHLDTYRVIAADPPWEHDNYGQAKHGAAKSAYSEMPLASLQEMPVGALGHPEGSLLFLWCTAVQAADGAHHALADAWGYRLTTRFASWVKAARMCAGCDHPWEDHDPPLVAEDAPGCCGSPGCLEAGDAGCEAFVVRARRGPGSYSMQGVEDLWLGVSLRGDATWSKDRARRDIPEILFAPVGEHSAKPERIYERIEALWPSATPRLELFARRRRPGWNAWGNEAPDCSHVFGSEVGSTWPVPSIQEAPAKPREATASLFADMGEAS